jgi:hypothetical protein
MADKENSGAMRVISAETRIAHIDAHSKAHGLGIQHTAVTGYCPDGELSKWIKGSALSRLKRWKGCEESTVVHEDGSPMRYTDFTDADKDFFYGEWSAERSIVPIVMRFRGDLSETATSWLWWYGKDVRACLEANTSFYAAASEIVKMDAHITDIQLAVGDKVIESVLDPIVRVRDTYNIYDAYSSCYRKKWVSVEGKRQMLACRNFDSIIVRVTTL